MDSENEQTEHERLTEQVFSISLILKDILMNLDRKNLLRTSLVNKNWNFLSRKVLREKEKCLAIVATPNEETNFCHNLKNLNDLLLNSAEVPFNGICIDIPWDSDPNHQCSNDTDVTELMSNILRIINLKYLDLDLLQRSTSNCIVFECIREIIVKKASSLEGLRLFKFSNSSKTFLEHIGLDLVGHWLPNVRVLEMSSDIYTSLSAVKELLDASPKLQKLDGTIETKCLESIVTFKATKAVKDFNFTPRIHLLGYCTAFCLENPQFEKLSFSTGGNQDANFSKWSEFRQNEVSRILKHFLICSQDSLKAFTCHQYDLILMTSQWEIPTLKNVTYMELKYYYNADECKRYSSLRKIEWAKYFPNLKEVYVTWSCIPDFEQNFYITHALRESNVQFVCESVKILRFKEWSWLDKQYNRNMQTFINLFPNLKEIHINDCEGSDFAAFLKELWTGWPDMEVFYATVEIYPAKSTPNYDSLILGISEEEADYLLENFELENLEIVPTRPSIFNLRRLKKLEIHVFHSEYSCNFGNADSTFLTRLAGQCAFSRIPGLEVEIYRDLCEPEKYCAFTFDQLKPFAKVMEEED